MKRNITFRTKHIPNLYKFSQAVAEFSICCSKGYPNQIPAAFHTMICNVKPLECSCSLGCYIYINFLGVEIQKSGNDSVFHFKKHFAVSIVILQQSRKCLLNFLIVLLSKLTFLFEVNDQSKVLSEVGISVLKTMLEKALLSLKSTRHSDKTDQSASFKWRSCHCSVRQILLKFKKTNPDQFIFMETLADALLS